MTVHGRSNERPVPRAKTQQYLPKLPYTRVQCISFSVSGVRRIFISFHKDYMFFTQELHTSNELEAHRIGDRRGRTCETERLEIRPREEVAIHH
eukprot:m.430811 g.430811  ORF g.430811 m.430811 type:complete len:94 (-) comp17215_c0_seq1:1521-1802(-)